MCSAVPSALCPLARLKGKREGDGEEVHGIGGKRRQRHLSPGRSEGQCDRGINRKESRRKAAGARMDNGKKATKRASEGQSLREREKVHAEGDIGFRFVLREVEANQFGKTCCCGAVDGRSKVEVNRWR